ncbi:hypothetical protein HPB48_006891 [Haemaphysalis longicornis]|uniref:Uncharacterized protein n=1 Tax=Haemaphysalis longicornis TaxID=44386 RepID=A0A9J6FG19_HAELO|nr:hypothetical protein HPB48_006891 [Haemaphysalis longicornis]
MNGKTLWPPRGHRYIEHGKTASPQGIRHALPKALLVLLLAVVTCWAADPKPAPAAAAAGAAPAGDEEIEGRTLGKLLHKIRGGRPSLIGGLLAGHKNRRGGQQHSYQQGSQGFNQGSQGFDSYDKSKDVQGFRETKGYRTETGFEETSFNRYGTGAGGFQGGFNQQSGGKFQEQGQQYGGHGRR